MRRLFKYRHLLLLTLAALAVVSSSCNTTTKKKDPLPNEEVKQPPPPPGSKKEAVYLSIDTLQTFIKSAPAFTMPGKLNIPFDKLVFNKVIAYDFDGIEEPYPSIFDRNNKFIPIVEKQKALTAPQTKELIDLLTSHTTYRESTAACFNPHLAFVFYNGETPAFITDICLDCNYLLASKEIPAMNFKKINKATENEYSATGFSNKGKSRIKQLAKQLDFFYGQQE